MLELFDGQMSFSEINTLSFSDMHWLKYWREKLLEARRNSPTMKDLERLASGG